MLIRSAIGPVTFRKPCDRRFPSFLLSFNCQLLFPAQDDGLIFGFGGNGGGRVPLVYFCGEVSDPIINRKYPF